MKNILPMFFLPLNLIRNLKRKSLFLPVFLYLGCINFSFSQVHTIPVVVHVLHNNPDENLSDQVIQEQIQILTRDFNMLNPLQSSVPAIYADRVGNPEIEFCLATQTVDGFPTNGITRTSTDDFSYGVGEISTEIFGVKPSWDKSEYYNIYVCKFKQSAANGFTYLKGQDVVVINYNSFGIHNNNLSHRNLGTTLTHETGHWLNLKHLYNRSLDHCTDEYENNQLRFGDFGDEVSDTPQHEVRQTGCSSMESNGCGEMTMPMNYMSSVDDNCFYMFTQGQVDRMRTFLETEKSPILSSNGCDTPSTYCTDWIIDEDLNHVSAIDGPLLEASVRRSNIIIKAGVSAVIQNSLLELCEGGKIILEEGASLVLWQCQVKPYNNGTWQGIEANFNNSTLGLTGTYISDANVGVSISGNSKLIIQKQALNFIPHINNCEVGIKIDGTSNEIQNISDLEVLNCDVGILLKNSRNMKIENSYFWNNDIGISCINSSATINDGCQFQGGEVGIQAVGTHPLGSGLVIGDMDSNSNTFDGQSRAAINSLYSWSPLGITAVNNEIKNTPTGTLLQGGDNFAFSNNSIDNVTNGFVSTSSTDEPSTVRCNEIENATNASSSFIWQNRFVSIFENHFGGDQNTNIGMAGALVPNQIGPFGETASNCFSANDEDIVTMDLLGSTQTFDYKYYAAPDQDCDHNPNVSGDYTKTPTTFPSEIGNYCANGMIGTFNLIDPTGGGSNTNIHPDMIGPDSVDPSNPYDPTGPPIQDPPSTTGPNDDPPTFIVCLPCLDDAIDDAINNSIMQGGDNPTTEQDENNGSYGAQVQENIMNQWINFGIYVAIQTSELGFSESILSDLVGWEWEAKRLGLLIESKAYNNASQYLNTLRTDNTDQQQFKQVQEINIKRLSSKPVSSSDFVTLENIANDKYSSRGAAKALIYILTGAMADPVLPIYGKTINPRSSAGLKSIIYPNPVNALLNIDADKAVLKISIHNSSGTLVNELQSTSAISNVDVSELAIGLYIMTLTDEKGERYLEKIIIQ